MEKKDYREKEEEEEEEREEEEVSRERSGEGEEAPETMFSDETDRESKIALLESPDGQPKYVPDQHRRGAGLDDLTMEMNQGVTNVADYSNNWDLLTFFMLGLINNSSFVIFAASAKEIASSSVGLVYLCASIPSFGIRISAPYWFDKVSYKTRISAATILMVLSFTGVALAPYQWLQLLGVMLTSAQQGLGEASFLSLCSRFGNKSLTAWSSGTGVAGLFGYAWIIVFKTWIGLDFRFVLLLANVLAVGYAISFSTMRSPPEVHNIEVSVSSQSSRSMENKAGEIAETGKNEEEGTLGNAASSFANTRSTDVVKLELTAKERLTFSLSLWHITVPLIIVYMAEYAAQAGAWAAIGFPTHDKSAREKFYEYANWCYQGGVFLSRSSGVIWQPGKLTLWGMSLTQCVVLSFFVLDARFHFWYDNSLLGLAFFTGLLGGAVYVNAFRLITEAVPSRLKEIAMTAGAVSSDFGTNLGEALGLGLQTYLYRTNGIQDG